MDSLRIARYPFLKDAAIFAEENSANVDLLISSPSFEEARNRGLERILSTIEKHEISDRPLINEYDRLIEVLSYPYARMIVSCIDDRYLTKRYALAEASRMNTLLKNDPKSLPIISQELEVISSVDSDDNISIHFSDYIRYSCVMKAVEWKLINTDLRDGFVHLEPSKFDRLLQNALQGKIESELPLDVPRSIRTALEKHINHITMIFVESKKHLSPTGGKDVDFVFFPPCMRVILANAQNGINLPHSARFAVVSFLNALGMTYDDIISLFSQSPDFDESKSSYQIKHITGEIDGREGYVPPECSTMRTNGLCFDCDDICDTVNHPLLYYKKKSKNYNFQDSDSDKS